MSLRRTDLEAILGFLVDVSELESDEPYPPAVVARLGDLAAARMSDVTDRRRYVESAFYREYFGPFNVEYMIDLGLPAAPRSSASADVRQSLHTPARSDSRSRSSRGEAPMASGLPIVG